MNNQAAAKARVPGLCVVVMGVCGCGKSTVGAALARALKLPYVEGDELHPQRNVALMAAGTPLTDEDRREWLQAIASRLSDETARQQGVVVTCSALKLSYRDVLRAAAPALRLVHLHGSSGLLAQRLAARKGHYMPPSLLQSQLETLETPGADERALSHDILQAPEAIVAQLLQQLDASNAPSPTAER